MPLTPIEVLSKIVEDRVATTAFTSAATLRALYAAGRTKTKTNTSIDWDVAMGNGATAIEPITQDGADTATGDVVPANLRIGRYRVKHQFPISRVAIAEAATRAPGELQDLFNAHVDRGLNEMFRRVNQLIHTGDSTAASGEFTGLSYVANNANNYAGINVATYPAWKALRLDGTPAGTARPLAKSLLLDLQEMMTMNESGFDLIVTSPNTAKKYNALYDSINGGIQVNNSLPNKQVDLGNGTRTYNGRPIIEDPQAANGIMWFLNSGDIDLFSFDMSSNPQPMSQTEFKVATVNAYGLNINIAELPSNNSAVRRFELYVLPQLRVYNRKSVAVIGDIA